MPLVRGYHAGGRLDVRWPTSVDATFQNGGFTADGANALLLFASLDPDGLCDLVTQAIKRDQPLSAGDHSERVKEITARITELGYVEAALVECTVASTVSRLRRGACSA
jgi:hypothetical protein